MNKVHIIGRLTRDPEVRYSQGDNATATARFTLAVDRKFKKDGQQDADFIGCIAFGKIAEHIEKYYKQGMKMVLSGRIATGSYTNKEGVNVIQPMLWLKKLNLLKVNQVEEILIIQASQNQIQMKNLMRLMIRWILNFLLTKLVFNYSPHVGFNVGSNPIRRFNG
jgi:single stranded DNA-binding protein